MPIATHDMPMKVRQIYEPLKLDFDDSMLAIYPFIIANSQKLRSFHIIPSAIQYRLAVKKVTADAIYYTNAIMLAWEEPYSNVVAHNLIGGTDSLLFANNCELYYHILGHINTKGNRRLYITRQHIQYYIGTYLATQLEWLDPQLLDKLKVILTPASPQEKRAISPKEKT